MLAGVGFLFVLVTVGAIGLDDLIPRKWVEAGTGTITNIEETNTKINERPVVAYHFEIADSAGAEKITGISYGLSGKHETGDDVLIQQSGLRYRVQGLTQTEGGWLFPLIFLAVGLFCGIIGLGALMYAWFTGGQAVRLLQDGTATGARFLDMELTNMRVNRKRVMAINFEYQVAGVCYQATAHALKTARLIDGKSKTVLYDPTEPETSVVLEGYSKIRFDELSGQFWTNPLHCVLPFLAAFIVTAEIAAAIVLAIWAI
jgi:hypothetical protein